MEKKWVRRVALFLTGQTITLFGSMLTQFAISWHITLTTQSGLMLTIATLCGFLPQVLISLFAGVWADRYNRKMLIIAADAMIATFTAALAILFAAGYTELWPLFVISALRSIGAGVQMPAVGAFLPELAPQEHLMRVNGVNATIQSIMMLAAPAAAGALYAYQGIAPMFMVDVVTAIAGISLLLLLKAPRRERAPVAQQHVFGEMGAGAKYVMKTPWIRQMLGFYLFYALMFGPVVFLTPLMVARSFGEEPWRLMAHEIVFATGSILGGFAVSIWGGFKNKSYTLIASSVAFGLTTLVMGFSPNFWFYLAVMLLMGCTIPFINTGSMTILQTRTRTDMMGRVFSLTSVISSGAMPLSMAVFGPLADYMSVQLQLIITGAAMIIISLVALRFREFVAIGAPAAAELQATPEQEHKEGAGTLPDATGRD